MSLELLLSAGNPVLHRSREGFVVLERITELNIDAVSKIIGESRSRDGLLKAWMELPGQIVALPPAEARKGKINPILMRMQDGKILEANLYGFQKGNKAYVKATIWDNAKVW